MCGDLPSIKTLKRWPVVGVYKKPCSPRPNYRDSSKYKPPKRIRDLGDGTFISENDIRGCFRAQYKRCRKKCLPPAILIATPDGEVAVSELREGMPVWTQNLAGEQVLATIVMTSSVEVDEDHRIVVIELADGRSVEVSAGHPALDGGGVEHLRSGTIYDGSEITSAETRAYRQPRTFDLLPSGTTGVYWANGIPLRSTLE